MTEKSPTPTKDIRTLLTEKREEILRIASENKAYNVRIFGSAARGDTKKDSDVDFLVTFEKGASLLDLSGLQLDLRDLLGCDVDVISDRGISERFWKRIQSDVMPL